MLVVVRSRPRPFRTLLAFHRPCETWRLKASAMNQNAFTRTLDADGLNAGKGAGGGRDGNLWRNGS